MALTTKPRREYKVELTRTIVHKAVVMVEADNLDEACEIASEYEVNSLVVEWEPMDDDITAEPADGETGE